MRESRLQSNPELEAGRSNRMLRSVILCLSIAFLLVQPSVAQDKAVKEELERFQGTWEVVSFEVLLFGKTPDVKDRMRVRVEGAKAYWLADDKKGEDEPMSFTVDPTTNPKEINLTTTTGRRNQKHLGIYGLNGDELKLAFALKLNLAELPDPKEVLPRPKRFPTKPPNLTLESQSDWTNSGAGVVISLKRVKK
jgi:uncharacterized protein (TIGR03067 family)